MMDANDPQAVADRLIMAITQYVPKDISGEIWFRHDLRFDAAVPLNESGLPLVDYVALDALGHGIDFAPEDLAEHRWDDHGRKTAWRRPRRLLFDAVYAAQRRFRRTMEQFKYLDVYMSAFRVVFHWNPFVFEPARLGR
jgi:hypothetical protein